MKIRFLKLAKVIGSPLSFIWDAVYRIRRFLYAASILKSYSFHVPVISIGNLSFGGTGKTPFTVWLAQFLESEKKQVMILTRGYKGRLEDGRGILRSGKILGDDPALFGDEPILLSRKLKNASVVVGKRRAENLIYYFNQLKPDVVLLDDGHQHLAIKRNLSIVLFDALMKVEDYKVPPRGRLREGLTALQDADIVVIGRVDLATSDQVAKLKRMLKPHLRDDLLLLEYVYRPAGLSDKNYQRIHSLTDSIGLKVYCACGIAAPESFFTLVEKMGLHIIGRDVFPDHYQYKKEEITLLVNKAKNEGAILLVTEKDMVKMRHYLESEDALYLEISLEFDKGEEHIKSRIRALL